MKQVKFCCLKWPEYFHKQRHNQNYQLVLEPLPTPYFNRNLNLEKQSLTLGFVTASPPRFVTVEELLETAKGVTNMALAHEIVVNGDFRIKPVELPEDR